MCLGWCRFAAGPIDRFVQAARKFRDARFVVIGAPLLTSLQVDFRSRSATGWRTGFNCSGGFAGSFVIGDGRGPGSSLCRFQEDCRMRFRMCTSRVYATARASAASEAARLKRRTRIPESPGVFRKPLSPAQRGLD